MRSLISVRTERTAPAVPANRWMATLLDLVRGHWGVENGLHRTLGVQIREDDCRMRTAHAPAVIGILRRAALNMVRTLQQNFSADVSIGLWRDRIGRQP